MRLIVTGMQRPTQEFLVRIHVNIDPSVDAETLDALTAAERTRGAELVREGAIREIWRVPGTRGNVGRWRAENATALHTMLSSLPMFAYMTIEVTALAEHPLAPIFEEIGS
jgi:muconolactone D-isomerase